MFDGIIFDVDGTLWDSRAAVAKAWNRAVKRYSNCNVTVEESTFDSLFGLTNDVIMEKVFPMLTRDERIELEQHCNRELHELLLKEPGRLYAGIPEMFENLSRDYKLFIVSNCQKGYIETFVKVYHFEKYITGTLCFGDTGKHKGLNIRQVVDEYGLKTPVYVGDMEADGRAAAYAGVPILYVTYGFGTIPGADYVADSADAVVRIIRSNTVV